MRRRASGTLFDSEIRGSINYPVATWVVVSLQAMSR